MKKSFLLVLFVTMTFVAKAADTTYVNAPEISGMLVDYISKAYSYKIGNEAAIMMNENPEIVHAFNKWIQTDEGNAHALTDVNWEQKYESFFKMFPGHKMKRNIACKIVKAMTIINFQLFQYAINANIIVINDNFEGVIFFDKKVGESTSWTRTIKDPVFKSIYENNKADDGMSWFYKIQKAINKQKRVP